ncbi:hypothetical protein EIN_365510, partial [Entamoeba invadens IP1]
QIEYLLHKQESKKVIIATSSAWRGVDIKLLKQSQSSCGLNVIIPFQMANQRALEQANGRSGRQGQPGTVNIYLTDKDLFYKIPEFEVGNDNLAKLELYFSEYLRTNFRWIYNGKDKYGLGNMMFPIGVTVPIVLDIFANLLS